MPIKVKCLSCGKDQFRSPSKVQPRNYCNWNCYNKTRIEELKARGVPYQITIKSSQELSKKRIEALRKKTKGAKHYSWKGEQVSYAGLHMWLNREKTKPKTCSKCGKKGSSRSIQWANIDGKYRRVLSDYIALCSSCHKLKDLAMKSIQDVQTATQ